MHRRAAEGSETSIMSEIQLRFPEWQVPLQQAILEFDRAKFQEEIKKVEAMIHQRMQNLPQSSNSHDERVSISDALLLIRSLKRDRLQPPAQ
jgi:hypothetical protein